ncbi:neuronal regeneration related protein, transcript variant X1 [Ictidomys tridecemlineatus]|nr:neuronal regeneration related protein, transcript variant X1 [Ictidomys tridecemlineatus]
MSGNKEQPENNLFLSLDSTFELLNLLNSSNLKMNQTLGVAQGSAEPGWSPWTEEREHRSPRLLRFSKWFTTQNSLSGSVKNHFQTRKWREGFLREDFPSQRK